MLQTSLPNVVSNAGVEQDWILGNDANGLPETGLGDITNVLAIDQDTALALLQVVESVQEAQDGGLARARLSNERDRGALGHLERDAFESGGTLVVREADVLCAFRTGLQSVLASDILDTEECDLPNSIVPS